MGIDLVIFLLCFEIQNKLTAYVVDVMYLVRSVSNNESTAFSGDDDNAKEEEVYQDLCSIQNNIARSQVFILKL